MSSKESATRHGSEGSSRDTSALVAPLDEKPRGGMDGLFVRRMRLGPEPSEIGVDEAGVDRSGRKLRAPQELAQEREIGLRPDDDGVVELVQERGQRLGAVGAMNDHLGDHRIIIGRDAVAGGEAGVDPDALLALEGHGVDQPGRGQKVVLRILGVDARFDRRAGATDLALLERQRLPGGHPELPFDQVEAGHRFGHRMLDLEPRVHLEEIEVAGLKAARRIGDEFDRACADITRGQRRLGRGFRHGGARLLRQSGRRAFLDHLLMPALRRAVALVEVDASPMRVGEHLQFDVARRGDVFFDQHPSVAERSLRLAAWRSRAQRRIRHGRRRGAFRARPRPRSP